MYEWRVVHHRLSSYTALAWAGPGWYRRIDTLGGYDYWPATMCERGEMVMLAAYPLDVSEAEIEASKARLAGYEQAGRALKQVA